MKKNISLIILLVFFIGCETGTRYDKNATTQTLPKKELLSGLVDRDDIEALLDDKGEVEGNPYYDERDSVVPERIEEEFVAVVSNGLDVKQIREGKHEGYIRLVFDVYNDAQAAKDVGHYDAKYHKSKKDISVILHGYRKFSASLPSFPHYSVIEQIHFDQYPDDSGFKFHIKLRENAKVRIFDLKNPARIVFDIKPI
jgi:hypothetical protein